VTELIEQALLKSLAKARADRYQNMNDMIHDFEKAWTAINGQML
jgi:hypothetical protein